MEQLQESRCRLFDGVLITSSHVAHVYASVGMRLEVPSA